MNIKEAAIKLKEMLGFDPNVQCVGVRESNSDSFKLHPERFVAEITKDSLVVYTIEEPTPHELEIKEFSGFEVNWKKIGWIVAN